MPDGTGPANRTRAKKPVTKRRSGVVPAKPAGKAGGPGASIFGSMKGTIVILGDIVGPMDPAWLGAKPRRKG